MQLSQLKPWLLFNFCSVEISSVFSTINSSARSQVFWFSSVLSIVEEYWLVARFSRTGSTIWSLFLKNKTISQCRTIIRFCRGLMNINYRASLLSYFLCSWAGIDLYRRIAGTETVVPFKNIFKDRIEKMDFRVSEKLKFALITKELEDHLYLTFSFFLFPWFWSLTDTKEIMLLEIAFCFCKSFSYLCCLFLLVTNSILWSA